MTNLNNSFSFINLINSNISIIENNRNYSYSSLYLYIKQFTFFLLTFYSLNDLNEKRISLFLPCSLNYIITIFSIWKAGGIALPLNISSTILELEYYLTSTEVDCVITNEKYYDIIKELTDKLNIKLINISTIIDTSNPPSLLSSNNTNIDSNNFENDNFPDISIDRRAMILFTSGTTSKPKGVVTTHKNIHAQILSLVQAWEWSENDSIPLFLPVHHIHGIINILCCCLWSGATLYTFTKFDIPTIIQHILQDKYTLLMGVPTVYVKLIQYIQSQPNELKEQIILSIQKIRLNVSGSAACPITLFEQWKHLTNQVLLERYGMTEIGMAISNPLHGERLPGTVGYPLPGVTVELFTEDNQVIHDINQPGEIRVKGDNVFLEYWNNSTATSKSFQSNWFCSGDIAVRDETGRYTILGRNSIDIIKSGGYKLSAIEIENILLQHEKINECAVVGVPDEVWGETVCAVIALQPNVTDFTYEELKVWCQTHMSSYKIPKEIHLISSLPRNAMGKIVKTELKTLFQNK